MAASRRRSWCWPGSTIGAALLLPIAIRRRELAPLLPHWRWLVLFALVEIVAPWLLLSEAETRLSSSLSGLLIASVPILVAVFSRLTGGQDRLTLVRWAGLARRPGRRRPAGRRRRRAR